MKNNLFLLVLLAFFAEKGSTQTVVWPFEKAIDSLVAAQKMGEWSPGFSILIAQNGQIVYEKQRGMANYRREKKINAATRWNIGSITKPFTAQAILLLEERGLLKTTDPASRFLPEIEHFGPDFTIEKLLNHTSGVPDHLEIISVRRDVRKKELRPEAAVKFCSKMSSPSFRPGTDFMYSNTGYMLLAAIVERVSSQKFGDFLNENIFQPLKMDGATVAFSQKVGLPAGEKAYHDWEDMFLRPYPTKWPSDNALGATGVFCTLRDLAAWDSNFSGQNRLGNRQNDLIEKMKKPSFLNDGSTVEYGAGLFLNTFRGEKMIAHAGEWAGFWSQWRHFPDRNLSVIVASNTEGVLPFPIADSICARLLGRPVPVFRPEKMVAPPLEAALFEGIFLSESNLIRRVQKDSAGLTVSLSYSPTSSRFVPIFFEKTVSDSLFFFRDGRGDELVFLKKGQKIDGFWWSGGHFARARRFYSTLGEPQPAQQFVGKYRSKSLRKNMSVRLFLSESVSLKRSRRKHKKACEMKPLGGPIFLSVGCWPTLVVRFVGDEMIVGSDWFRGLWFKKR